MHNTSLPMRHRDLGGDGNQQEKVQVCENGEVRRIAGIKRVDKRRTEELREDIGVKKSFRRKLARSWLKWAGHLERIAGERLTKRAGVPRMEGRRRRGRPVLRWEDSVKRYLAAVGVE